MPGFPAARMGDPTAHGGTIAFGDPTVIIGDKLAARIGDPHICPVHGGGVITSASTSVIIGNAFAARQGDLCNCASIGTSGIGVPAVVGPGAPPKQWSNDGQMDKETDKTEPARGPHIEGEMLDTDQDGSYDTVRGEASAVRMRNKGSTDIGPIEVGGSHNFDVFYARGQAGSTVNAGIGGQAGLEGGMVKQGGEVWLGPAGDEGRNPFYAVGGEYDLLHAEAQGDVLVGDDGKRVGLALGGKAGAEVAGGKVTGRSDIFPFLRFFGLSAEVRTEVSGSAVSAGVGAGAHAYWDKNEERFHLGGFGTLKALFGLGLKADISFGKLYQPLQGGNTGTGSGGIPNVILMGEPTVIIG